MSSYSKDSVSFRELAKHGLLEPLIRRRILEDKIMSVAIEEDEVEEALSLFMKSHNLESTDELEDFFALAHISPEDIRFCLLKERLIEKYISLNYSEREIGSKFLAVKDQLTTIDFQVLSSNERSVSDLAYLLVTEEAIDLREISLRIPNGTHFHKFESHSLAQVTHEVRYLLSHQKIGACSRPVLVKSSWKIFLVTKIDRAVLNKEMVQRIGKTLLEEEVNDIYNTKIKEIASDSQG